MVTIKILTVLNQKNCPRPCYDRSMWEAGTGSLWPVILVDYTISSATGMDCITLRSREGACSGLKHVGLH